MRKCPKCGTELPDEALFCNECGEKLPSPAVEEKKEETPDNKTSETSSETSSTATEKAPENSAAATTAETAATSSAASGTEGSYTAPIDNSVLAKAKEESKNSNVGIIAVAVIGVLAVALIIILICNSGGYKTPIKNLVNNFNKGNTDVVEYLSCVAPGFAVDLYKDVYGIMRSADKDVIQDFDDAVADGFKDLFDDTADAYGDDYELSYEIRDAERLDDRDIKDIEDAYEDLFDMIDDNIDYEDEDIYEDLADALEDEADISLSSSQIRKLQNAVESFMKNLENFKVQDAYEVKVRLVMEGEDDSYKETISFYVIKVNGDWFIDPNSFLSAIGEGSLSTNLYGLLWYL